MSLREDRLQTRTEIGELQVKIKSLKSESAGIKDRYRAADAAAIKKVKDKAFPMSALKEHRQTLEDRIEALIDLNSDFDVPEERWKDDGLCDLQQEVVLKRIAILSIDEKIDGIDKESKAIESKQSSDKVSANESLTKLKEEIEGLEAELAEKVEYEKKLSRVINPNSVPKRVEESVEGKLNDSNSNLYLIVHVVGALVISMLVPPFAPVAIAGACINFWRLSRKFKKHQRETDYKNKL